MPKAQVAYGHVGCRAATAGPIPQSNFQAESGITPLVETRVLQGEKFKQRGYKDFRSAACAK